MKHIKEAAKSKREDKKVKPIPFEGLEQIVRNKPLYKIISREHVWQTKGKVKRTIITHDGVKRIADFAMLSKDVRYAVLTQPDAYNNYQYTIQATVCYRDGKDCATEIGEANRSNLGSRGRNNPANMAEKRAYDRAVFRLLGITGILSEEELSDEEAQEEDMHGMYHEQMKQIAPLINQITLAKGKEQLVEFNRAMKENAKKYDKEQLDYLRELYKKALAAVQKTSF